LGATGAVGQEFVRLFEERSWPIKGLRLLASERSVGKKQVFRGEELCIELAEPSAFEGIDVAFFSAGASRSREFAPPAMDAGAVVIDNSSAFRMDADVPLVVPEINFDAIKPGCKLVANPNCTAIVMLMAVAPLRQLGDIDRIIMSSYQSASGAGAMAMQELVDQSQVVLAGGKPEPKEFPHQCAFNVFSHNTPIDDTGYNEEERKVIAESRKIMGMPDLRVNVTCVRVPVLRAHSESITVEFAGKAPSVEDARLVLSRAEGVKVIDDRETNTFPMPAVASGKDEVFVGRIRQDLSNPNALCLFASGDQLLKGAALNAVQIGERMFGLQ
jgi:aspartate-semialdehyde dehydrogenase